MLINKKKIAESLRKAYQKLDIFKPDFDRFISAMDAFFNNHNPNESEEHQKNNIAEFLKNSFYKETNLVNTKKRIDLAIYNGNDINDTVGVLIEVKSTANKSEMFSPEKPNVKALQEVISYYLEESITLRNKDIKHIIICTPEDWFIFEGAEFEQNFYNNKDLIQKFNHYREELFGVKTTGWFYDYLRDEIIPGIDNLNCTYINFREYKDKIHDSEKVDDLILLYKILSPEHLLKKPFANDSNSLDVQFYDELLHLIGLEEVKETGKKVLLRLPENKRFEGSMLENTIHILEVNNSLDRISNLKEFGDNRDEQLFSIALELSITWINRILFLKLLESQLIKFNNNDYSYKFLTNEKISDFDELNELFFEVLAVKPKDRVKIDKTRFSKIPYLNSSLFELTELEKETFTISSLKDRYKLPIFQRTVLKTLSGDKRAGELKFQEYLFEFLDSYNFASVSKASIQPKNKTIINSSVLGLIFEKLNGYKDGSFFTPGYITMYMSREAISLAVVNKFNQYYKWSCKTIIDVYNKLESCQEKYFEYNKLINSIRLVDPAVGSGHFLVSALNEFINIKAELGILLDKKGKRLKEYKIYIENDELIIVDNDDEIFEYLSPEKVGGIRKDELQRVQETFFQEKQTIIENCLFGADINPKSVSISRLRLWIELLKFMYYKNDDGIYVLETLPNIDINIKTGNSLVSRFPVTSSELNVADSKVIPLYKEGVNKYKNVKDYQEKKNILKEIENCKMQLKGMMSSRSTKLIKLIEKRGELKTLISQTDMFHDTKSKKEEKEFTAKVNTLTEEIMKLENEVDELNNNPVYHNALEWRFEFPEVLDDNGNFTGFDVVMGNPPYFSISTLNKTIKDYLANAGYKVFTSTSDIYTLFIELGYYLVKPDGILAQIISNKWMRAGYGELTRYFLANETSPLKLVDFGGFKVFDSATVDTNILISRKTKTEEIAFYACSIGRGFTSDTNIHDYFEMHKVKMQRMNQSAWIIASGIEQRIKEKVELIGTPLKDWDIKINYGIKTGLNEAFIIDGETKNRIIYEEPESAKFIKQVLRGRDIKKYKAEFADLWLINVPKGFTIKTMLEEERNSVSEPIPHYGYFDYDPAWYYFKTNYPVLANYLVKFKDKAINRFDKGDYWWELRACAYLEEFNNEIIAWKAVGRNLTFAIWGKGKFLIAPASFFSSFNNDLKYLLGFLHSKYALHYIIKNADSTGAGDVMLNIQSLEKLCIPKISPNEQQPFIDLVEKILKKKDSVINSDTTEEEREIDMLVYQLFGLTEKEIKFVEGK